MGHFLAALLGKLCADEIKAWLPSIAERLKEMAVRRLPVEQRERYSAEWASFLYETPGNISKLCAAFGFLIAAERVSRKYEMMLVRFLTSAGFVLLVLLTPFMILILIIKERRGYDFALFHDTTWRRARIKRFEHGLPLPGFMMCLPLLTLVVLGRMTTRQWFERACAFERLFMTGQRQMISLKVN